MKRYKRVLSIISIVLCFTLIFAACGNGKDGKDGNEKSKPSAAEKGTSVEIAGSDETAATTLPTPADPSTDKLIAVTYDDGPYSVTTSQILDILEENGAKATFFAVGNRLADYPDTVRRIINMGCEIGSHTYDHKYLNRINSEERANQINSFNDEMRESFGYETRLLRAPGGHYSGVEDSVGMPLIQWSIDTLDWKHKDAANPNRSDAERTAKINEIVDDVLNQADSGDIILMHDIYQFTADLSAVLIPALVNEGFKIVTVSEMYAAYGQPLEAGGVYNSITLATSASGDAVEVEPGQYVVSTREGGNLNLRNDKSTSGAVLAQIPNGTVLTVTESVPGWAKCTYQGHTGWVSTDYIKPYN